MKTESRTGLFWLFIWFQLNIAVALLNKKLFYKSSFNFPILLSALHMLASAVCCEIFVRISISRGTTSTSMKSVLTHFKEMTPATFRTIFLFCILFSLNITFGNIAIQIVSLSLSQVLRSTVPVVTLLFSWAILKSPISAPIMASIVFICFGVAVTVSNHVDFEWISFIVLLVGIVIAALKVVLTNKYLHQFSKQYHPMEFLALISPFASIQMLLISLCMGELSQFFRDLASISFTSWFFVLTSSLFAFLLNLTNFLASKGTSAVTVSVTGTLKQLATVVFSFCFFETQTAWSDSSRFGYIVVGCTITFSSLLFYSYLKHQESIRESNKTELPK